MPANTLRQFKSIEEEAPKRLEVLPVTILPSLSCIAVAISSKANEVSDRMLKFEEERMNRDLKIYDDQIEKRKKHFELKKEEILFDFEEDCIDK